MGNYRAYVGPEEWYDIIAAMQFNLLTSLGLRQHHYLLDIGCGSLRAGRLFIPYLLHSHYYGIEPNKWLVEAGVKHELGGPGMLEAKKPTFSYDADFTLTAFNRKFDYLLAQSIFSHACERQIQRCLSQASEVMEPASIFAATYFDSSDPRAESRQEGPNFEGDGWTYPGCVFYTLDHIKEIAEEQGLSCETLDWAHPDLQTWVCFEVAK